MRKKKYLSKNQKKNNLICVSYFLLINFKEIHVNKYSVKLTFLIYYDFKRQLLNVLNTLM